jgi:hypothetical protein
MDPAARPDPDITADDDPDRVNQMQARPDHRVRVDVRTSLRDGSATQPVRGQQPGPAPGGEGVPGPVRGDRPDLREQQDQRDRPGPGPAAGHRRDVAPERGPGVTQGAHDLSLDCSPRGLR